MVNVEDIERIITQVLRNTSSLEVKCGPTIAEMHSMLDALGFDEQYRQLNEKGYLNPLEEKDFKDKVQQLEDLESFKDDDEESWGRRKYDEAVDELFLYGRRLIEGMEYNEPPTVNLKDFKSDKLSLMDRWEKNGKVESAQIEAQQKSINYGDKIDEYDEEIIDGLVYHYEQYSDPRLISMGNYHNGDCSGINYGISNLKYINKLSENAQKNIKDIDSLMEENTGLLENTLLYRGGHWDIHLNPGDHSNGFKGYTSTTFLKNTAQEYVEHYEEQTDNKGMLIQILAPQGTKGICGNDNRMYNGFVEHEYTLARNTGFTVVDVDYDKMVATIILDEP